MSETYTKLFTSITASTVWMQPAGTRLTWITMLAMADQNGCVYASVPGLAHTARLTREEVECALECFLAPDPDSRSSDFEGRRIEEIKGGWRLLNHAAFHSIRAEAERAAYKREWDRKNRPARKSDNPTQTRQSDKSPTQSDSPTKSDRPDPPDQTKLLEARSKALVQPTAAPSRFQEFWLAYPNKKSKQEAEKSWRKLKLDSRCDELIDHVRKMAATDADWLRGYIPMGSTYLNQARWDDVPRRPPTNGTAAPSKTLGAMQTLQGIRHGLAGDRTSERANETALLGFGSDPGE